MLALRNKMETEQITRIELYANLHEKLQMGNVLFIISRNNHKVELT